MTLESPLRAAPGEGSLSLWRRARRAPGGLVVAPLAQGSGAFIASTRLVTMLELPGPVSGWRHRLLEGLQARRSRLLVATDRDVAVACVRRWGLDLSRIRLVPDFDRGLEATLERGLEARVTGRAAWHSAR